MVTVFAAGACAYRGHIRVSARVHSASDMVEVSVSDTGIGIPKSKLVAIFLPFEQVRAPATCDV